MCAVCTIRRRKLEKEDPSMADTLTVNLEVRFYQNFCCCCIDVLLQCIALSLLVAVIGAENNNQVGIV
jgi:hypothetical protein